MWVGRYGLYTAWVLACLGTLVSLYYSHIRLLEPCHLCWYQRICLFPLTIVLGMAAYRGFLGIAYYALPLTLCGLLVALYQVGIQEIPGWNPIDICGGGPSCVERLVVIGPLTVPMLSACLFALMIVPLTATLRLERKLTLAHIL